MNKKQKEALRGKFSDALMSTDLMVSTISEWYDAKHRKPSKEEVVFINSIVIEECPFCGSKEIRRDGFNKKTGLAIRECKTCGRKFNPLAGTIFDSRKIPLSEWIEFLVHLFQFHSIKTSSIDNRNAVTTGLYWLSKVFLVVDDIQSDIVFPESVDRRNILSKMEVGIRHQKRQAAQWAVEKSVLRMLCNRRKAMRAVSLRRGEAKLSKGAEGIRQRHRSRIDGSP